MGIIIAVVAVLLTHMDRNQVGNMNPNISLSKPPNNISAYNFKTNNLQVCGLKFSE